MNNLTSNYSHLFYKDIANDVDVDLPLTVTKNFLAEGQPLTDDINNFLLGTSEYARDIQSDIDLYVTRGRHNQESFHRKLDPIEKSVWRTENPLALLFKDVANFDAQNPIIGSLLREIDLGKNKTNSQLIANQLSRAPNINDTILLNRFKILKDDPINYNNNDNNNNNNNDNDDNDGRINPLGPPPPPPTFNDFPSFSQTPTQPPNTFQPPSDLLGAAPLPPLFNDFPSYFPTPQPPTQPPTQRQPNVFDRFPTTVTPGEQVMSKIERVIEKEKTKETEITPSDPL